MYTNLSIKEPNCAFSPQCQQHWWHPRWDCSSSRWRCTWQSVLPTPRLNLRIGLLLTPVPQVKNCWTNHCQCNFNGLARNWAPWDPNATVLEVLASHFGAFLVGNTVDSQSLTFGMNEWGDGWIEWFEWKPSENEMTLTSCQASNILPRPDDKILPNDVAFLWYE